MTTIQKGKRLISLDVLRGFTIAGMLLVNDPGTWRHVYPPLLHAKWHGLTFTDLIFPFFLFIVGVSMSFSFAKRLKYGDDNKKLFGHVIRRTITLLLLGLFLAWIFKYDFSTLRIPGVLQRIALCYFFVSIIIIKLDKKGQVITGLILIVIYWAAMKLIPVPGYGAGDFSYEGNLCGYIDSLLLKGHLYKPAFDPEGLLSTLPAVITTLIGVFIGDFIRSKENQVEITNGLFLSGTVMMIAGYVMSIWLPVNKQLWTNSYAILTAGMGTTLLALSYWFIDVKQYQKWATPFLIFGSNAIATYFLSALFARILIYWKFDTAEGTSSLWSIIYRNIFQPIGPPEFSSLLFAVCYVLLWMGLMYPLYRKRIYIKV